jgi:tetratricopeptide (TPR) repeat protein
VRRSFDFAPLCNDLYYFTGLYNYYREAYPKAYPVYQSLAILFPDGDIEKGLKELQSVAANSVVLRAEAYFLLAWIYLNYENNYSEALYYCKSLYELYPDNLLYRAIYIKNLLLINRYDEAEKLINAEYKGGENLYSQAQLSIVKGILQEKKYFDNDLAQQYYTDGISAISGYGKYGNEFAAYAYYGLSRISEANGDKHTSRTYRKEATKLAAFRKISFDK